MTKTGESTIALNYSIGGDVDVSINGNEKDPGARKRQDTIREQQGYPPLRPDEEELRTGVEKFLRKFLKKSKRAVVTGSGFVTVNVQLSRYEEKIPESAESSAEPATP
jgi:hypothetical protein